MDRSAWWRWAAGALLAGGGAAWVLSGVLVVWGPVEPTTVYTALVPVTVAVLLAGLAGVDPWLGGPRVRRPWRGGLAAGLRAMSSDRYRALSATEADHDESGLSARRAGLLAMRAGGVAVVLSSLVLQGQVGALRTLLHSGWFLFLGGALALAVAVMASDDAPRPAGALLAAGSLLVFSPVVTVLYGNTRRPGMLGPLLPRDGGLPVVSLALWLAFGAGCLWLGAALWSSARRSAGAPP